MSLPIDLNHALATQRMAELRREAEQRRLADCVTGRLRRESAC
jgi:hypothetical protein